MANIKPAVPKGTRDFSPAEMVRRNYIFDTIRSVFHKYGYQEIQTPAMENLSTLTGKYGDEGDKLMFKVLESGEYTAPIIKNILPKLNDLIIEKETKQALQHIASDFSEEISNAISLFKSRGDLIKRDNFFSVLHSFQTNTEKIEVSSLQAIKEAFINYLFSRGKNEKFRKFKRRIDYYSEITDSNIRRVEISKGLNWATSNGSTLIKLRNKEIACRKNKLLTPSTLTPLISEKALRYDLTVPFARYVVMHQNEISFPFKRFQIQPVWRADRPQRGRYREFYQCDADVVGSESLLNEAEFALIYQEALTKLGLKDFTIKINNRKILSGIAEIIGKPELIVDMTVAIDKLDKIGLDGVSKELLERGFTAEDIEKLKPVILLEGSNEEKLAKLKEVLKSSETGLKGISEIEEIFNYLSRLTTYNLQLTTQIQLDITLARGLNYYTGAIFEVKSNEVQMGSIGGGGRYDDLTGMFGLKGLTGVGISFGADRIYDVMEELKLFPESTEETTKVLISNFDKEAELYALPLLQTLRAAGIAAELYPAAAKLKKQLGYADDKKIPFAVLIGSEEMQSGKLTLKNMRSGEQEKVKPEALIQKLLG